MHGLFVELTKVEEEYPLAAHNAAAHADCSLIVQAHVLHHEQYGREIEPSDEIVTSVPSGAVGDLVGAAVVGAADVGAGVAVGHVTPTDMLPVRLPE